MKTSIFTESLDLTEAQIDKENRSLKGVILIRAGMTKNRRYYSEDILNKSAHLFEGVKAYDSHKIGVPRQVSEITGWYSNVRYENGALRADRYFSRTRAGEDVLAIAEDIVAGKAPRDLAGLSIHSVGTGSNKKFADGDALNVESITAANSVDDVTVPAAGGTYLTASVSGDELVTQIMSALSFEEWFQSRPDFIKRVQNEMKAVRQEDAVKAATAEADRAKTAFTEAQSLIETLQAERDAAQGDAVLARRELALEKAFRAAQLPRESEKDLRERLIEAAPETWLKIIQGEKDKLKALGLKPTVNVTGAGQQIAHNITESVKPDPVKEMRERIRHIRTPEELKAIQDSIGR